MGLLYALLSIVLIALPLVHCYLIARFIALSYKYHDTKPLLRHLGWLALVTFLPVIGYFLYYNQLDKSAIEEYTEDAAC